MTMDYNSQNDNRLQQSELQWITIVIITMVNNSPNYSGLQQSE